MNKQKANRHVVVISVDALLYEDMEALSKLSFFKRTWENAARVNRVRSIYPTVTYPCHATMMTGVYPQKHGIFNNELPALGQQSGLWQHMREGIKVRTLFDYAKAQGLTTASVFWPVTGNDPAIDYLINEYWPQTPHETTYDCFVHSGSSPAVMQEIIQPNLSLLENKNRMHPWADAFLMRCASDILRMFKPNLLMVHPANIDAYRHETGLFSEKVTQGYCEINLWLEQLYKAAEDAGIAEEADFFVVSDHGQLNVQRNIALNVLLAEHGFIDVAPDGSVQDYRAFIKSCGMSALVYLKDSKDLSVYNQVYALLTKVCAEEVFGISRVFTAEEASAEEKLAGDFSFVLETDGYTAFSNSWSRPLLSPLNNQDYRYGRATHGYLPAKGPQPTFYAFGPHIQKGVVLNEANLVDEAPTFAAALGLEMEETDGRCLSEILCLDA